MSDYKTLKSVHEDVQAAIDAGVTSADKLATALESMFAARDRIKQLEDSIKSIKKSNEKLSEACSKYALAHPKVFEDGKLYPSSRGGSHGDLKIGSVTYHFSSSYEKPKRIDGGNLSQDFLSELPEGWAKVKWDLDTTSIDRLGVTADQLKEKGLYRPATNDWTASTAS